MLWKKIRKNLYKIFFMSFTNRRYVRVPAVFESIRSADPRKLFVIVLAFNMPDLVDLHYRVMKKFFRDEYEYFVMDNSSKDGPSKEIKAYCLGHGLNYVRLPHNPGMDESINPGLAFNWIYRNLIDRLKPDRFGFIDTDLFPTEPVSVSPYLAKGDAWGIITERRPTFFKLFPWGASVCYLWLGLLFFHRKRFEEHAPNFLPGSFFRQGIDSGGRVPVDIREIMKLPDVCRLENPFLLEIAPGVNVHRYGKFVHFSAASFRPHALDAKKRWVENLLKNS